MPIACKDIEQQEFSFIDSRNVKCGDNFGK